MNLIIFYTHHIVFINKIRCFAMRMLKQISFKTRCRKYYVVFEKIKIKFEAPFSMLYLSLMDIKNTYIFLYTILKTITFFIQYLINKIVNNNRKKLFGMNIYYTSKFTQQLKSK